MKKLIIGMAALVASALPAMAAEVAYDQNLVNQVVTTTTSFTIDASQYGIDSLSFQVTVASATPQISTFTDGTVSTGIITVANVSALATQSSSNTLTVVTNANLAPTNGSVIVYISSNGTTGQSGANILSGSSVTINGVNLAAGVQWNVGTSSNATAINLNSAINSYIPNVSAALTSVGGSSVTITCNVAGSFCNSYRITASTAAVAFSTSGLSNLFTGGNDNPSFTLNGVNYPQGSIWSQQDVSSNTAVSIMNGINGLVGYSASTNTTTSVLIKVLPAGSYANTYTLTTTTASLAAKAATFKEGYDNASLVINGRVLTQGTQWTAGASSATAANAISSAIASDSVLSGIMIATAPLSCVNGLRCGVVVATGTINTTGNNYLWYSSTPAALSISNGRLFGGTTSSYVLNGTSITIVGHTFATGEEVKFTSGTIALGGLTNQTSYYVTVVDGNDIGLIDTSTGALAGKFITLTSTSTSGPHTFTLTPLGLSQSAVLTWSVSNDGVNFSTPTVTSANVTIPVNSLNTPWASTTYGYDFGSMNYNFIRLTVTGPAAAGNGGFNTMARGYGKRYWR